MVKGTSLAENVLVLRRGEQHGIHREEGSAICPAKRQEAESLLVSHGYMVEYTSRKLCALVTGTLVKRIIDDEALPPEVSGFRNCSIILTASRVVKCSQFT